MLLFSRFRYGLAALRLSQRHDLSLSKEDRTNLASMFRTSGQRSLAR
jgi:hypothetical protein